MGSLLPPPGWAPCGHCQLALGGRPPPLLPRDPWVRGLLLRSWEFVAGPSQLLGEEVGSFTPQGKTSHLQKPPRCEVGAGKRLRAGLLFLLGWGGKPGQPGLGSSPLPGGAGSTWTGRSGDTAAPGGCGEGSGSEPPTHTHPRAMLWAGQDPRLRPQFPQQLESVA